ncbi:transglutaminase-like domain-containing protein [Niabella ginsengisoli]|uniref:Transglutaminase-like domain-containing protein n=1 Tax=Niabella ginsengisoli TaxID=522298 RepID=A0ABS9SKK4_9BACT|nr:transglutaminase-like domain-containing protein [Niabella ginsengisoli]MCH5598917.1 transglutaminase-like domain-containing protein [Niabella ginsengisoli]
MGNNTINTARTKALISLLDDPDTKIYDTVRAEFFNADFNVITELQTAFDTSDDELKTERIVEILDRIKCKKLQADIENWSAIENPDLMEGMLHIASYGYPNFDLEAITSLIDEITNVVTAKIEGKAPEETAKVLNEVILKDFKFRGNFREYSALKNSFINKMVETRATNPIGLSIIYLLVAKSVGIPLVGINSPGHFILGYLTERDSGEEKSMNETPVKNSSHTEDVDGVPFDHKKTQRSCKLINIRMK